MITSFSVFSSCYVLGMIIMCCSIPITFSEKTVWNSSRYHGQEISRKYWNENGFKCKNVSSESCCRDVSEFIEIAEEKLYNECEKKYSWDKNFTYQCKDGVDDAIKNREKACKDSNGDPTNDTNQSAERRGYDMTINQWEDGGLDCQEIEDFIEEVRDSVFDECTTMFERDSFARQCEVGANNAIEEIEKDCDGEDKI